MDKPKVIYIMGCGRSGTTILTMILGNHSGFLSVGELNAFRKAWQNNEVCSCGRRVTNCKIWHEIGRMFYSTNAQYEYGKMCVFQADFERQRAIWKQVFGIYKNQEVRDYRRYIHKIFWTLHELSSCKAVIDSSKSVGRALSLLRNEKVDAQIIHLVRDPRGLCYSYQKTDVSMAVKKFHSVALYWNSTNLLCELLKLYYGHKRIIRIRYEDLVFSPNKTLDRIQDFLKEDLLDVKHKINSGEAFERGHVAKGNYLRTQKAPLTLKPDYSWKTKLSTFHQTILSILCFL